MCVVVVCVVVSVFFYFVFRVCYVCDVVFAPVTIREVDSLSVAEQDVLVIGFPPVFVGGTTTIDNDVVSGLVTESVPVPIVGASGTAALSTESETTERLPSPMGLIPLQVKV